MKFCQWSNRGNNQSFHPTQKICLVGLVAWLLPLQDQLMLLVTLKMAQHLALVGKGREIGRTSGDRDSVVQFGSQPPLVPGPSTHLLTSPNSCAVQFGNCRRPDILKPNLISTSFPFPLQPMCTNYNIAHQFYILLHLVFYNFHLSEDKLI